MTYGKSTFTFFLFYSLLITKGVFASAATDQPQPSSDSPKQATLLSAAVHPQPVPEIAKGHEEEYQRFLKGALVIRQNFYSDEGKISLPIASLKNPLGEVFNLENGLALAKLNDEISRLITIATGYRKQMKEENKDKLEIWITPRFLIEKELTTTAGHFKEFLKKWPSDKPIGIFVMDGSSTSIHCLELTTWDQIGKTNFGKKAMNNPEFMSSFSSKEQEDRRYHALDPNDPAFLRAQTNPFTFMFFLNFTIDFKE